MNRALIKATEYRALMMFDRLPEGCITFMCMDEHSMPHIRPGELIVIDTADRTPRHLDLYVIEWMNGRRQICQARDAAKKPTPRLGDDGWSVGSLKNVAGRAAVEAYIAREVEKAAASGGVRTLRGLGWSDGWFTSEHLSEKLVGCVIGLYAPDFEEPKRVAGRQS